MATDFPLVNTRQYKEETVFWLEALKRQENVSVMFVPRTDRLIRLGQLLSDHDLLDKCLGNRLNYIFQKIDLNPHDVENLDELCYQIEEQLNLSNISTPKTFKLWLEELKKRNLTLILIIPEAEKYLNTSGKLVLSLLTELINNYSPLIRILSLFEANITHPQFMNILPSSARFLENFFYYPLYAKEDTRLFTQLLTKIWRISLSKTKEEEIIRLGGGHFWLLKEYVRRVVTMYPGSYEDEGITYRLRTIYSLFSESEQSLLQKIIFGKSKLSEQEVYSLEYFKKMRIIDDNDNCFIGAFNSFLKKWEYIVGGLQLKENHIYVNNVPVDKYFSRKEYRALKLLLEKANSIVTRDELAKSIWPTDTKESYSDWALDQHIARLRKRMKELSLSPRMIQVIRGKGYLLKIS